MSGRPKSPAREKGRIAASGRTCRSRSSLHPDTLLVVAGVSYRGIVVSRESDGLVRHTHEVLENLEALLFANATIKSTSRAPDRQSVVSRRLRGRPVARERRPFGR